LNERKIAIQRVCCRGPEEAVVSDGYEGVVGGQFAHLAERDAAEDAKKEVESGARCFFTKVGWVGLVRFGFFNRADWVWFF